MSAGFYFKVGSRHEDETNNGAAHFLEHMIFKGTKKRTARQLNLDIDRLGADSNALTGHEATCYYLSGLAKDTEALLEILTDFSLNSTIPEDELEIERGVILQEIVMSDDDESDVCFQNAMAIAFKDQPLGRPILGPLEGIKKMNRDTLLAFRDAHYHAGNLIISVAGNVDPQKVLDQLEKLTGNLRAGYESKFSPASYNGGGKHEERPSRQVNLTVMFNSAAANNKDRAAENVLGLILGGGISSRLYQSIREERGLVYGISAGTNPMMDTGFLGISAGTGPDEIKELLPVLGDELQKIITDEISEEEVEIAKNQLHFAISRNNESRMRRMLDNAANLHKRGNIPSLDEVTVLVNSVTVDDVREAARRVFSTPPVLSTTGPGKNVESYETFRLRFQPA
jgi:predicted Zn-dependent peptidase